MQPDEIAKNYQHRKYPRILKLTKSMILVISGYLGGWKKYFKDNWKDHDSFNIKTILTLIRCLVFSISKFDLTLNFVTQYRWISLRLIEFECHQKEILTNFYWKYFDSSLYVINYPGVLLPLDPGNLAPCSPPVTPGYPYQSWESRQGTGFCSSCDTSPVKLRYLGDLVIGFIALWFPLLSLSKI